MVEPDSDIVVMEVDEEFSDDQSETINVPHIAVKLSTSDSNNNFSNISESKHSSTTPAMSSQAANPDEPPPLEEDDSRKSMLYYKMEGRRLKCLARRWW